VAVCRKLPKDGGVKWRHDRCAELLAKLSSAAGRGGSMHDRPILAASGLRPADFMESPLGGAQRTGHMVDYTAVVGGASGARAAEEAKSRKYAALVTHASGYSFEPFATANDDGSTGPAADAVCRRWAKSLAAQWQLAGLGGTPAPSIRHCVGRIVTLVAAAQYARYVMAGRAVYGGAWKAAGRPSARFRGTTSPSRRTSGHRSERTSALTTSPQARDGGRPMSRRVTWGSGG
jgi:hypothetical protein